MSDPQQVVNQVVESTPIDVTSLVHALIASFSVILVSELGDKTFIITAIMAMKNSRFLVFLASAMALLIMTILSVGMGVAVTVIPKVYTHYVSIVLFILFGFKMMKEAYDMNDEGEDFDQVERSLEQDAEKTCDLVKESPESKLKIECLDSEQPTEKTADRDIEASNNASELWKKFKRALYVAPIVIKVFTMVFVAEWGDRSQISTVILAAREDIVGVFIGSYFGHILCTGLAVIGGRFVADMISVRTMTLLGGIIFLMFAIFAIISGPE